MLNLKKTMGWVMNQEIAFLERAILLVTTLVFTSLLAFLIVILDLLSDLFYLFS